jgi:large subunit ribosomal protein L10
VEGLNAKELSGKVAAIFSYGDEVAAAKTILGFKKDKEDKIAFLGGVLEGKFLSKEEMEMVAKLPSKKELYAKMLSSMQAPVSGFVNVLAGNLRGLVTVLKAVGEKKSA